MFRILVAALALTGANVLFPSVGLMLQPNTAIMRLGQTSKNIQISHVFKLAATLPDECNATSVAILKTGLKGKVDNQLELAGYEQFVRAPDTESTPTPTACLMNMCPTCAACTRSVSNHATIVPIGANTTKDFLIALEHERVTANWVINVLERGRNKVILCRATSILIMITLHDATPSDVKVASSNRVIIVSAKLAVGERPVATVVFNTAHCHRCVSPIEVYVKGERRKKRAFLWLQTSKEAREDKLDQGKINEEIRRELVHSVDMLEGKVSAADRRVESILESEASMAAHFCQEKLDSVAISTTILANRIASSILASIASCHARNVPPEYLNTELYDLCSEVMSSSVCSVLGNKFADIVRCRLNSIVLTEERATISYQLELPIGIKQQYESFSLHSIGLFGANQTTTQVRTPPNPVVFSLQGGKHLAVLGDCQRLGSLSFCLDSRLDEPLTRCVSELVSAAKSNSTGAALCPMVSTAWNDKEACQVQSVEGGLLLVSSYEGLRLSQGRPHAMTSYATKLGAGVKTISEANVGVACNGIEYRTTINSPSPRVIVHHEDFSLTPVSAKVDAVLDKKFKALTKILDNVSTKSLGDWPILTHEAKEQIRQSTWLPVVLSVVGTLVGVGITLLIIRYIKQGVTKIKRWFDPPTMKPRLSPDPAVRRTTTA